MISDLGSADISRKWILGWRLYLLFPQQFHLTSYWASLPVPVCVWHVRTKFCHLSWLLNFGVNWKQRLWSQTARFWILTPPSLPYLIIAVISWDVYYCFHITDEETGLESLSSLLKQLVRGSGETGQVCLSPKLSLSVPELYRW